MEWTHETGIGEEQNVFSDIFKNMNIKSLIFRIDVSVIKD